MHALASFLTVGVLSTVFGLAVVTFGVIIAGLLYAPAHQAHDYVLGWRHPTCPATGTMVDVRVRRTPRGVRRLAVVSCSLFGGDQPTCHQGCVNPGLTV
jgi:hypothetical protein